MVLFWGGARFPFPFLIRKPERHVTGSGVCSLPHARFFARGLPRPAQCFGEGVEQLGNAGRAYNCQENALCALIL